MNSDFFIHRPYLSMVVALVTALCGVLAILALPVAQYPNVTPPQVAVTTNYPGADAQTLLNSVIEPLESKINGVRKMIYLNSTGADSGSVNIVATFDIGSDGRVNAQDVQNRVDQALPLLPETVQREGVIVQEQTGNILLCIALYSPRGSFDSLFLNNYAQINLTDRLRRIPGVSQVTVFGGSSYAMRLWLDTDKLASLNLPVETVLDAVKNQNLQISSGAVGAAPEPAADRFRYTVRTRGRLVSAEEFRNLIVSSTPGGAQVRLGEVAKVELAAEEYGNLVQFDDGPAAILLVYQLSDGNALQIAAECRKLLAESEPDFPPDLAYAFPYDSTRFIAISIQDVAQTLLVAAVLVALVVLLFLQNVRMALVPTLAIPVSILGTFAGLYLLGYSINLVTLFALVLAIGIVVDDAIIVIENVHRLMKEEKLSPVDAASKSMRQISGAIIATTLVLLAMFVPICFLRGITGELYRQFGVTISIAVLLSAVNALTLSPALAALFLRPADAGESRFFLCRWFNAGFNRVMGGGAWLLGGLLRHAVLLVLIAAVLAVAAVDLFRKLPPGFIPAEDQGVIFGSVQLPAGSSLNRTGETSFGIGRMLAAIPGVRHVVTVPGFNIMTSTAAADYAFVVASLEPWAERLPEGESADRIAGTAQLRSFGFPESFSMFFQPPPIPGIGMAGGFNYVLQEQGGTDAAALENTLDRLLVKLSANPKLRNLYTTFRGGSPFLRVIIDREKAFQAGVSPESIDSTLESTLGTAYLNDFNLYGQVYQVEMQARGSARDLIARVRQLHVPNSAGQLVSLSPFIRTELCAAPESLSRYNLFLSAQIQGEPAPGVSSGEAMAEVEAAARTVLPPGFSGSWTDMSYQEQAAGSQSGIAFVLAILFIYLFLAALYESWLLPFAVMVSIFPALLGGALLLYFRAIDNNLYTQIGVVLLFAMSCKTAILIVDFAVQQRDAGMTPDEAAASAARLRFRAIVMTASAFVLGTLPLLAADGPGAMSQRSIGAVVVGGMLFAAVAGVLLVPGFFALLQRWINAVSSRTR